jgi:transcriptional regulator with XRE-family HTH domain
LTPIEPDVGPGASLRAYRERALLTQEDLAERTGLSTRTIRRLESGQLRRPRLATIRALASQLGLSAAEQSRLAAGGARPGSSHQKVMMQTRGGHQVILDDTPGIGGITLQTATGQRVVLSVLGIEIDNGMGASIRLTGALVQVNNGALEVT